MKTPPRLPFSALLLGLAFASRALAIMPVPPAGTATGSFAPGGKPPVQLKNAAAFVDAKDDQHPTVLILSDKPLPADKWTSDFDIMRNKVAFSGAVFFLNKEGAVYRCDIYDNGRQASVSGYFTLKLDAPMGKDLVGSVHTNSDSEAKDPKLDANFHAAVK